MEGRIEDNEVRWWKGGWEAGLLSHATQSHRRRKEHSAKRGNELTPLYLFLFLPFPFSQLLDGCERCAAVQFVCHVIYTGS